ncbi:MAG: DUF309 domain-containing protein [Thermoproteota archaeon]|jgi:uncharacterized protein|nr:DUF309 domain-containing protein [Thermoproteota archaeon]
MVHLQNTMQYSAKDANSLLIRARELVEPKAIIRDARVSKRYIEFDASIPADMNVNTIIQSLEAISSLASYEHIIEYHMEKDKAIRRALQLFNDEKYWQAHEALEYVWKNASGVEKDILNGIILVAAAFVHDEKDESDICLAILQRARKKLEAGGIYYGINIDRILERISQIINSGKIDRFTI